MSRNSKCFDTFKLQLVISDVLELSIGLKFSAPRTSSSSLKYHPQVLEDKKKQSQSAHANQAP